MQEAMHNRAEASPPLVNPSTTQIAEVAPGPEVSTPVLGRTLHPGSHRSSSGRRRPAGGSRVAVALLQIFATLCLLTPGRPAQSRRLDEHDSGWLKIPNRVLDPLRRSMQGSTTHAGDGLEGELGESPAGTGQPRSEPDPVVKAVDDRIRRGALRQLEELDLDDYDARLQPLSALAGGKAIEQGHDDLLDEGEQPPGA